jgi:hypothetical protein
MSDFTTTKLAPLLSHTTGETRQAGASFGSQTQIGRQTAREPTRQDLSTVRTNPHDRGGYSIRRLWRRKTLVLATAKNNVGGCRG